MDLLTTYTHDSELQGLTKLSPISTLYKYTYYTLSSLAGSVITTMENLQLLCSGCYCPANIPQLKCQLNYITISSQPPLQNSTELNITTVLVISSRHGPHRKCRISIIAWVFVAAGTCLKCRCVETVAVYSPISRSLHNNDCTRYNTFLRKVAEILPDFNTSHLIR
jgi:hypothetical protein